uniref:F-box domain-containing protein n=1 Tax=Anopheles dirus TaxID=7168 RepID=A0A182MXC8_9DIPT
MANINQLPTEILEMIFDHLDYKSRRNATLVCQRWDAVALSERFTKRNVIITIDGSRALTLHKHTFHRPYQNLSLKLDNPAAGGKDTAKGFRLLPTIFPTLASVKLEMAVPYEPRWFGTIEHQLDCLRTVDAFHLTANCNLEANRLPVLRMARLRTLTVECGGVQHFWLIAPELRRLQLRVHSVDQLYFLLHVLHQLHTLEVVFTSKEYLHLYDSKPTNLHALSIDRRHKGMMKNERDPSITFFGQLVNLRRLELKVKFVDSYVLCKVAGRLPQLAELSLEACEGMIELSHIASLRRLERLWVVAGRINLANVHLPALRTLLLGAGELSGTTKLEGIETLMTFLGLQSLTLVNVSFYPEMHKLTPSYSLQRMALLHYRQLNEAHVLKLVKRFPALRWLRISHCHGIYRPEIDKLKRLLPKVAIAFDEVKSDRI